MVAKGIEQQLSFSDLNFPTQYHGHDRFYTDPGTRIHPLYAPQYDESGHFDLVQTGEVNVYDEIQSHADSVDINILLKRYAEGDPEALSRAQAAFMDVSGVPDSYAEVLNRLIDAENAFMQLPLDERAKYDHSFEVWLSAVERQIMHPVSEPESESESKPEPESEPKSES